MGTVVELQTLLILYTEVLHIASSKIYVDVDLKYWEITVCQDKPFQNV